MSHTQTLQSSLITRCYDRSRMPLSAGQDSQDVQATVFNPGGHIRARSDHIKALHSAHGQSCGHYSFDTSLMNGRTFLRHTQYSNPTAVEPVSPSLKFFRGHRSYKMHWPC